MFKRCLVTLVLRYIYIGTNFKWRHHVPVANINNQQQPFCIAVCCIVRTTFVVCLYYHVFYNFQEHYELGKKVFSFSRFKHHQTIYTEQCYCKRKYDIQHCQQRNVSQTSASFNIPNYVMTFFSRQKIVEQEDEELVVFSIREELMQNVMDEIRAREIEKESIKYTVNCAHKALLQLLSIEFYVHDKGQPFYSGHPAWVADEEPTASPADSWAAANVPILRKPLPSPAEQQKAEENPCEAEAGPEAFQTKSYVDMVKLREDLELSVMYETKKTVSPQSTEDSELHTESDEDLEESYEDGGTMKGAGDAEVSGSSALELSFSQSFPDICFSFHVLHRI